MKTRRVKVAAAQMTSGTDKAANVAQASELLARAVGEGATYVQLPEYFNYLGPASTYAAAAEPIPGPTTTALADLAKRHGVTVHLGSLLERVEGVSRPSNTSVVIGPSGAILGIYRKVHLFDVEIPEVVTSRESDVVAPGEELVVARLAKFTLGLSVCFDLRFPELYRALSAAGAEVLAVPSAFNAGTGLAHWEVLVRSRAIENNAYVVAAAQSGTTAEGIATYGHAMIVDPWGAVLDESKQEGPDLVTAVLDLDDVSRRRAQIPVMRFRRPLVYGSAVRVLGA